MAPRVLFVVNDHVSTEALLGEAFTEIGFDIDTFEVVTADRWGYLPLAGADDPAIEVSFPDVANYDVIVPLGARWAVYDDALTQAWVGAEMQMVRDAAEAGIAVLGVCFGGQLIAQAHGGTVTRSPAPEIGWHEIASGEPGLVPVGPWFQWHFDRWTLPPGAREIARNAQGSQAFLLGRSLALQFHPEVDRELVERWIDDDRDGEAASLGVDADELLDRTARLLPDARQRLRALVRGFLDEVAHRGPVA